MKCYFCGYSGDNEQIFVLLGRFKFMIRKLDEGGIHEPKRLVSVVGSNEEPNKVSIIFHSYSIVEVRASSISVSELSNVLHREYFNGDRNYRVRLLPKGDFIVNFV